MDDKIKRIEELKKLLQKNQEALRNLRDAIEALEADLKKTQKKSTGSNERKKS